MRTAIDRIESAGRQGRARRLFFQSGDVRTTSAIAVKTLNLQVGLEVETTEFESALCEVEPRLARERALALLGHRERSATETANRLVDDGYPESLVRDVIEWLMGIQLLSDERFAVAWARSRRTAGYGRARVARELALKGVAKHVVADAVGEAFRDVQDVDEARRILGCRPVATPKERQRQIRRLVGRGFTLEVALRAMESDSLEEQEPDLAD